MEALDVLNPRKRRFEMDETKSEEKVPERAEIWDRPAAETVEAFFENPTLYRPKEEFLSLIFDEETTLTHCIKIQNVEAVAALLAISADPNLMSLRGVTPVSGAAHKGNVEILKLLVNAGANVNNLNQSGSTALIQASHFGHVEAVRMLLENDATADYANNKGTTALMRASQEGHVEISKLLVATKADVNKKNNEGMNALMLASQRGHAEMVMFLIKSGANMDEQTSQGSTALMLACKRGHEGCVNALVSMGAEVYMRDSRGRTARDTAMRRNHTYLLELLDTQHQIRSVQEFRRQQRSAQLADLKKAYENRLLQLDPLELKSQGLMRAIKNHFTSHNCDLNPYIQNCDGSASNVKAYILNSKDYTCLLHRPSLLARPPKAVDSAAPTTTGSTVPTSSTDVTDETGVELNVNDSRHPTHPASNNWKVDAEGLVIGGDYAVIDHNVKTLLKPKLRSTEEWEWPILLHRAMSLPLGVFDLIVDMMPAPRIWQWSLWRLRQRIKLNPHQAALDLSILMDEILADSNIFQGADQTGLLVRLQSSPQIHPYLFSEWGLPPSLLRILCTWADVQSLLRRYTEADLSFKSSVVKDMHSVTGELFKWYRSRTTCQRTLQNFVSTEAALAASSPASRSSGGTVADAVYAEAFSRRGGFFNSSAIGDALTQAGLGGLNDQMGSHDTDNMDATDAGAEEGSLSTHDGFDGMEQDTETEMMYDEAYILADDDPQDDSDTDSVFIHHGHHIHLGQWVTGQVAEPPALSVVQPPSSFSSSADVVNDNSNLTT